jgi:hypothetical protein
MSVLEKFKQDKLDKTLMAFDEARVKMYLVGILDIAHSFSPYLGQRNSQYF